jgi:hypothetical protein
LSPFNYNNQGNVRITQQWREFVQWLSPWRSNNYDIFWVCVCSLSYPARKAHAPCCHLWPVRFYHIFPYYLINCTMFGKTVLNIQSIFRVSPQRLPETLLILRTTKRDTIIKWT